MRLIAALKKHARKIEIGFVGLVTLGTLVALSVIMSRNWYSGLGDTAQNSMIIENIEKTGEPRNQLLPTLFAGIKLASMAPKEVCAGPLPAPELEYWNHFRTIHPYFIFYLLAPFLKIASVASVLGFATGLAFIGLIFFTYVLLRKGGVGPVPAIFFCFAVVSHPAWRLSLLGQPYADRFFLLPGFLLMLLLSYYPKRLFAITLTLAFCCLINDRMGVIAGACVIGFAILENRLAWRDRATLLGLGLLAAFLGIYLIKFYVKGYYITGSVDFSFAALKSRFTHDGDLRTVFLVLTLGTLGLFGLFSWRSLLVALVALMPNLLVTIGGAELNGWSTHYHSTYFPILVWAAGMGFIRLYSLSKKPAVRVIVCLLPLLLGVYYERIGFPTALSDLRLSNDQPWIPWSSLQVTLENTVEELHPELIGVNKALPRGVAVMTPEFAMPVVYHDRRMFFYPVGMDVAEYAVLPIIKSDATTGESRYGGAFTYQGEAITQELNRCLLERMEKTGWDLMHPVFELHGIAVVKKAK